MNWQAALKNARFEIKYSPDTIILDVRTPQEYAEWHLDGAVNVPISTPLNNATQHRMNVFIARLLRFSRRRERPMIVYCKLGVRATAMENALYNAGFMNVINLGGIQTMPLAELRQRGVTRL